MGRKECGDGIRSSADYLSKTAWRAFPSFISCGLPVVIFSQIYRSRPPFLDWNLFSCMLREHQPRWFSRKNSVRSNFLFLFSLNFSPRSLRRKTSPHRGLPYWKLRSNVFWNLRSPTKASSEVLRRNVPSSFVSVPSQEIGPQRRSLERKSSRPTFTQSVHEVHPQLPSQFWKEVTWNAVSLSFWHIDPTSIFQDEDLQIIRLVFPPKRIHFWMGFLVCAQKHKRYLSHRCANMRILCSTSKKKKLPKTTVNFLRRRRIEPFSLLGLK